VEYALQASKLCVEAGTHVGVIDVNSISWHIF